MASTSETYKVEAECLCKAHKFSTEVPVTKLPLLATACHCNSCRHLTGALYSIGTTWPGSRQNVDTSKLKSYAISDNLSLLFCETCSAPLFYTFAKAPEHLGVVAGVLKNHDIDLVKIDKHVFVGDTIDGGATMWLRKPNSDESEARRFKEGSSGEQVPDDWPPTSSLTGYEKKTEDPSIPVSCHCKGVNFHLHREDYEGKTEQLPWFIDPKTHKSIASFDACDSCRLQSGVDIFHWTFSNIASISFDSSAQDKDGTKVSFNKTTELRAAVDAGDAVIGTLAYYQSSPDVQRYFCKVCSATVFYACDDRPDCVDVAIGLLNAPDGARAEGFLSWILGGKISWVEDTDGGWREGLFKRAHKEAEEWRIQRGYPKDFRRVETEEKEKKESAQV